MSSSGGLIQITNYGSHDIMLTDNPEITFFKLIYRRYTNFGKIFIEQKFDNPVGFDKSSTLNIPKAYDLLSNLILKIKLPILNLDFINEKIKKKNDEKLKTYEKYYSIFLSFKLQLQNLINNYFNNLVSYTTNYVNELNTLIRNNINIKQYNVFFEIVDYFFNTIDINIKNVEYYKNSSLYKNINDVLTYNYTNLSPSNISLEIFKNLIDENMLVMDELNKILYSIILDNLNNNPKININWINKIAIYMFDYLEINIGSNQIVKLYPDYIDKYGQLRYRNKEVYDYMINDKIINDNLKSIVNKTDYEKNVYLPVPFWFSQSYSMAFPLIALQFNNLQFKIKTKNYLELLKINYTDDLEKKYVENIINIYKEDIITYIEENTKNQLNITVLLEYISLDTLERRKFAQAGHEYLITQNQVINFRNASILNNNFNLSFFHCVTELLWLVKTNKNNDDLTIGDDINENKYYTQNDISTYYSFYNNNYINYINSLYNPSSLFNMFQYMKGLTIYNNKLNIGEITNENYLNDVKTVLNYKIVKIPYCLESTLIFNSVTIFNQSYQFFNYLQPYKYYNSTPELGTNVYSFALYPTDIQPSGSVNFGRIPAVNLRLDLLKLNNKLNEFNDYNVSIYVTNQNVLRIIGGIAGLAFQY